MWTSITPEFTELTTAHTAASQRRVITDAVAAVLAGREDDKTGRDGR